MYRPFYGLARKPFEMSPDPFFFYPTPQHKEALAIVQYGVLRQKGFIVVTGEVGTGKTLIVRCLLDALTRHRVAFAFIYNPRLSVQEFLKHVLADLGLPSTSQSKVEMLSHLNSFLVERSRAGTTTALVVDEAQLLSWDLLEEIRLLTNFETSQRKLLQIVLVGQPELDQKLDSEGLRQLKQRVGLRCQLEPLKLEELRGYIQTRLELAGANGCHATLFSEDAVKAIHEISAGFPRLANTLCENALVSGYGQQAKEITREIVREVAANLKIRPPAEIASASQPLDSEMRRKIRSALFRMIDEMDRSPDQLFGQEHGPRSEDK